MRATNASRVASSTRSSERYGLRSSSSTSSSSPSRLRQASTRWMPCSTSFQSTKRCAKSQSSALAVYGSSRQRAAGSGAYSAYCGVRSTKQNEISCAKSMRGCRSRPPRSRVARSSRVTNSRPRESAAEAGLDHELVDGGQPIEVVEVVDGRDHGVAGGEEVQQVLLADLVGLAAEVGEHRDAALPRRRPERLVPGHVVDHRPAVADHDDVEAVHEPAGGRRVADRDVEVPAEARGQVDVLVAVAAALRLVAQVADVEEAGAGRGGGHPGTVTDRRTVTADRLPARRCTMLP